MIIKEQIDKWYDEWLAIDINIEPTSLAQSSTFYIANKAAEFERDQCAKLCEKLTTEAESLGCEPCDCYIEIRKRGEK